MVNPRIQGSSQQRQAIVVGGGLAGVSTACSLADAGYAVTLLEKRPYLGGRVFSFKDKATGQEIDNGQHIFLKCCTGYIGLLKQLGVYHRTKMQPRLSVPVIGADGLRSSLWRSPLPSPLHFGPALALYRHLSVGEKLAVARALLAMKDMSPSDRDRLDGGTFHDWLAGHGQSEWAMLGFWDLIVLPTLNDDSRRVSAAQAIMVFQEGLLAAKDAADIGLSTVGLSSLLYAEARTYVESRGGRVLAGRSVAEVAPTPDGVAAKTHGGETISARQCVLALPPKEMCAALPDHLRSHPFFSRAARLKTSPIVNMHLWLDRRVTSLPFAAYLSSEVQWIFNKGPSRPAGGGKEAVGQHLVISISGAHRQIDTARERLYHLLLEDLRQRLPRAREANVLGYTIVRERDATFSQEPGSAAWRLPARTPVPGLFLAGAWTATGWPATMESAVRSGVACAREMLNDGVGA